MNMNFYQGCISSFTCTRCGLHVVCDSSGKAGTREGNTAYVLGPCCCIKICPDCPKLATVPIKMGGEWNGKITNSFVGGPEYVI
jgi:hypothetical protein